MHVDAAFLTLALLVALALAFDFMNGFHDAANSIATVVSTRVLKPYQAVIWAALFNFVAFWLFETKVAATIGKGIIEPSFVDNAVIFGALIGAIVWNVVTWYFGIPSSSSHALIGGMMGAAMAKAGVAPLMGPGIIRTTTFILVAPMLGMFIGGAGMLAISWACFRIAPEAPRSMVPAFAAARQRAVQHWPRQQRCAEDHGHHLAAADVARPCHARTPAGLGGAELLHGHLPSARCSAAGASSRPWGRSSPS